MASVLDNSVKVATALGKTLEPNGPMVCLTQCVRSFLHILLPVKLAILAKKEIKNMAHS